MMTGGWDWVENFCLVITKRVSVLFAPKGVAFGSPVRGYGGSKGGLPPLPVIAITPQRGVIGYAGLQSIGGLLD